MLLFRYAARIKPSFQISPFSTQQNKQDPNRKLTWLEMARLSMVGTTAFAIDMLGQKYIPEPKDHNGNTILIRRPTW